VTQTIYMAVPCLIRDLFFLNDEQLAKFDLSAVAPDAELWYIDTVTVSL